MVSVDFTMARGPRVDGGRPSGCKIRGAYSSPKMTNYALLWLLRWKRVDEVDDLAMKHGFENG
jgi:hypothetical protein